MFCAAGREKSSENPLAFKSIEETFSFQTAFGFEGSIRRPTTLAQFIPLSDSLNE
jgi:hypothetical protein